ncbi:MAG: HAD-IA family hydrolase [Candidatus Saccharibacteria bacterium]
MIKAVIFDLYGVLALNGWQAFKTKHFTDREDVWTEVFKLGRKVDAGQADYTELIRFTAEQTGESEATVRYQLEHTVVNRELLSYIRTELKPRYKLGILSNASTNKVIDELFMPEDEALFDAIVLSHHVGLTKPQAEMYHAIAARLRLRPAECLFVDDQERHAAGAEYAGMRALVYTDLPALKLGLGKLI